MPIVHPGRPEEPCVSVAKIAGKTRKVKQPLSAAPPIDPGPELGRGFVIPGGGKAMLKSCPSCGRIHDTKVICEEKRRRMQPRDSEADRFRSTAAWTRKSIHIKERDLGLCRLCLMEGVICWDGLEVHHIVPLAEDFDRRLDDENLITLCSAHHKEAERGEIDRGTLLAAIRATPPGTALRKS